MRISSALISGLPLIVSACAFVPKVDNASLDEEACNLYMPKWTLETSAIETASACSSSQNPLACLVAVGVLVPAGSLIVSGSIVVSGSTLRWLEYQGKCDDGVIQSGLALLRQDEES